MSQIIKNLASGPVPPTVATLYTENIGTATPSANNLNVLGGTGIATVGSGNTITINVQNGGFNWIETSVSLAIAAQTGVFVNANDVVITLPPTAGISIGATVFIYADIAPVVGPPNHNIVIQANTGQIIEIGSVFSSSGGTATHTAKGCLVQLVFKVSDTTWHAVSSVGTWTVA